MAFEQEAMTSGENPPSSAARDLDARKSKFARARRLLLELGVAGLGYALITRCQTGELLEDGEFAPDFTALDLEGRRVALSSFSETPLFLHFWATWCGVCRQEFSALNAIQHELERTSSEGAGRTPRLCTLAADGDATLVREFAQHYKLAFPILLAPASVLELYRVKAFPTSYFLAKGLRISGATVGMSSRWAMKARLSCASR